MGNFNLPKVCGGKTDWWGIPFPQAPMVATALHLDTRIQLRACTLPEYSSRVTLKNVSV